LEITADTLVADIAAHHLENNVLFPRVVSLQAHAADRGDPKERAR
jgi:hypothetical protein